MIAAVYARKSTDQNGVADDQKSVARQIEHARVFATTRGWDVQDQYVFVDDGISGAEFAKRPGFLRLMNALKPRPPFQYLVMAEESRLGREAIETAYALKQLLQAGVRVFFYLENRERTLDSPTDKIMMSLTAFADELEREKARQRTYDALVRKAKAGHVTGGRVFGYTNRRIAGSHVERVINPDEAIVIRRIFDLCALGFGQVAIAKKLNAEGAVTPRSQQGRPRAWAPSSVREVFYRELYRGVVVWNRTAKRNTWGQVQPTARPETEWLRVDAPALRIITDQQWDRAHARLQETRAAYLRSTDGHLWGRPLDGTARKYLLTGLARCGQCGGALEVRSGTHGNTRAHFYSCASYWRRGTKVCTNKHQIPLPAADAAVVDALKATLLTPAFADAVVERVLTRATLSESETVEARHRLTSELAVVGRELGRLVEALAASGTSPTITKALRQREARKTALESELAALDRRHDVSRLERERLEQAARTAVREWSGVLTRHTPQARQILAKMLRDKLVFRSEIRDGRPGFRFDGEGTITPLLTGMVPAFAAAMSHSQTVASPIRASWNQLDGWLRAVDGLRRAA